MIRNYLKQASIFIISLFSSYSILKLYAIDIHNHIFIFLLTFFAIAVIVDKANKISEKINWYALVFSILSSISYIIGYSMFKVYVSGVEHFLLIDKKNNLIVFLGLFIIIYFITIIAYNFINCKCQILKDKENKRIKVFLLLWLSIFICYLPYLLCYFPGIMTPDSISQWSQAANITTLNNHHPVIHTLFIKIAYFIGNAFNSATFGVMIYSLTQMAIMSGIFAYSIYYLYKKGVNKFLLCLAFIYFVINPVHGAYSITMWKDVLFGGFILLFTISITELVITKGNSVNNKFQLLLLIISTLGVGLFRNNGIYILIAMLPILFLTMKKYSKKISLIVGICLLIVLFVKGPILKILDIPDSNFAESVGIPIKQVASIIVADIEITDEQKQEIDKVLESDIIKEKYQALVVDTLKFHPEFNNEYLEENKSKFASIWLDLGLKHPVIYSETYIRSTVGFWYPIFWGSGASGMTENDFGLKQKSLIPLGDKALNYYTRIMTGDTFIKYIFNEAVIFWMIIFTILYSLYMKKYEFIIPLLILIFLWGTIMIASPLGYEPRYVYGLLTTPHIVLFLLYFEPDNKNNKKNELKIRRSKKYEKQEV